MMKRIVDGVAYNTDTSAWIARSQWSHEDDRGREVHVMAILFQTTKGAYFLDKTSRLVGPPRGTENRETEELIPMTVDEAKAWMLKGQVEVIHDPFAEEIPEAEPEAEQGATIYLRVPMTLKQQVEAAAAEEDLSGNAWVIKCVQYALSDIRSMKLKDAHKANASSADECRRQAVALRERAGLILDGEDSPDSAHLAHLERKRAEWWEQKAREKNKT